MRKAYIKSIIYAYTPRQIDNDIISYRYEKNNYSGDKTQ